MRVRDMMTTPAAAMGPGTDVAVLAKALLDAGHRSMPIVDGARLVGIVTRRDIVRVVARDDHTIAEEVRHRLEIYGGDRRWRVEVHDGLASIGDQFDDETDRHVATVLAEAEAGAAPTLLTESAHAALVVLAAAASAGSRVYSSARQL